MDEANLEGGCPLALAVLYEIAQKEQSPWYGYLQALPDQGEDLPIFWEEEEKELFNGTEMESAVRNDLVMYTSRLDIYGFYAKCQSCIG